MSLVMDKVQKHYEYASQSFEKDNIIGIFLIGSQNYGTDIPTSDVDTELIITPTLEEIYQNKQAKSSTITLPDSNEQIKIKDIRCVFSEFKKQNINTIEVLYTNYCILNEMYKNAWQSLLDEKEIIAHYDRKRAVKAIKGNTLNSYNRLFLEDGSISRKQVANIVRYEYFLRNFINEESYEKCLRPEGQAKDYIMQIRKGEMGEGAMRIIAESTKQALDILFSAYDQRPEADTEDIDSLLTRLCKDFIDTSFFTEYARNGEI